MGRIRDLFRFLFGTNDKEIALEDDPLVMGDKQDRLGWVLLSLLGGLIAVPFALVNGLINGLDSFGRALEGPQTSDETAIVPTEQARRE